MGPGGVVWGKNRAQKSRETVPLRKGELLQRYVNDVST